MEGVYQRRLEAFATYAGQTHASFDPSSHVFRIDEAGGIRVSATLCAFLAGWYETAAMQRFDRSTSPCALHLPYVKFVKKDTRTTAEVGVHLLGVDPINGDAFCGPVASASPSTHDGQELPVIRNDGSITNTHPSEEYQSILRRRLVNHMTRKAGLDIIRKSAECICFSPSLCAAIRGLYDNPGVYASPHDLDHRLFPIFIAELGVGVAFLSVIEDKYGVPFPRYTPLLATFVK
jgi:hypothetical protein